MTGCPIYEAGTESPLHIAVTADGMQGYVQCEKLALLDLRVRGHKKTGRITLKELMNITDAIQESLIMSEYFHQPVPYLYGIPHVTLSPARCPVDQAICRLNPR